MKKLLLGLIISVSLSISCASKGYKITGQFENDATGQVFLSKLGADGVERIDSARLVDGTFTFEGNADMVEAFFIEIENQRNPILLFVENTNLKVTGNTAKMDEVVVTGSELNDIFQTFEKGMPHNEKIEQMNADYIRAQQLGDQQAMASITADAQKVNEDRQTYLTDFLKANSNNVVGAFLTQNMLNMLMPEDFEAIMTELNKNLPDHHYTIQLNEVLNQYKQQQDTMSSLDTGKEAPLFTLTDINGKEVSLQSFRGKYVFIDFWASWCQPCRHENPNLVKAYKQFGGNRFEIISVSVDKSADDWRNAVKADGLTWTMLHDPLGNAAMQYMVETIPNTWLLDAEGKIIRKNIRGEELMVTLAELLK
ncbi:MAG: AhpC/TSA family protein [Cytophagaceae bacterium]|jgi:peroxiredoxin|nr:AhpC/TSA family protein [Cytophagaceae bacterium]